MRREGETAVEQRKGKKGADSKEEPLYRKIAEELRLEIRSGRLKPGDRLPSERALCAKYQVARGTLKAAFSCLAKEGLLIQSRGSGTYVGEGKREERLLSPEEAAAAVAELLIKKGMNREEILDCYDKVVQTVL